MNERISIEVRNRGAIIAMLRESKLDAVDRQLVDARFADTHARLIIAPAEGVAASGSATVTRQRDTRSTDEHRLKGMHP